MSDEDFAARRAAAVAVGLGALGVVVTSIFYALSPPQAALPHPIVSSDAIQATLAGATTMRIAGVIGMHADVLLAVGAWLFAVRLGARGFGVAALGWLGVALSGTLFVVVDALVSSVLPVLAAQGDSAYLGFRRLFDALFVIGTWLAGLASLLVLLAPGGIEVPVARPLRVFGVAASLAGGVSGVLFFCGFDTAQVLGLSVGCASLTFTWLAARLYAEPAAQLAPASGVALASQTTLAG